MSGCSGLHLGDKFIDSDLSNVAQLTVYDLDDGRGNITVKTIDISKGIFDLIDPVRNIQTRTWIPSNNTTFIFQSAKTGIHTLKLTDIDVTKEHAINNT